MLTSRASEKHQEYARQLGADAYFVKPCPIATLTAKIHELLESLQRKLTHIMTESAPSPWIRTPTPRHSRHSQAKADAHSRGGGGHGWTRYWSRHTQAEVWWRNESARAGGARN